MRPTRHLHLDPRKRIPLLRSQENAGDAAATLPVSKTHTAPPSSSSSTTSTTASSLRPSSSGVGAGGSDASVYFIGNATTIIEWHGLRILTDPNFLHAGDHVHLGPGVTAQRTKDPFVDLEELPPLDLVLLSHYHEDHFDRVVEDALHRDFPIVTTPHAKGCLTDASRYAGQDGEGGGEGDGDAGPFRAVHDLDTFESALLHIDDAEKTPAHAGGYGRVPVIKITAMPGKHVQSGLLSSLNDLLGAVPPTNGWLLEMGWSVSTPVSLPAASSSPRSRGGGGGGGDGGGGNDGMAKTDPRSIDLGYRIYISGDTLFVDELRQIPDYIREQQVAQYPHSSSSPTSRSSRDNSNNNNGGGDGGGGSQIDLMIIHLGGTTIPAPRVPLLMVTMDAKQGVELMRLLNPGLTIPVHFDDYSVMLSPLEDFKTEVAGMGGGWSDRVVYLERGEQFRFKVRDETGM